MVLHGRGGGGGGEGGFLCLCIGRDTEVLLVYLSVFNLS